MRKFDFVAMQNRAGQVFAMMPASVQDDMREAYKLGAKVEYYNGSNETWEPALFMGKGAALRIVGWTPVLPKPRWTLDLLQRCVCVTGTIENIVDSNVRDALNWLWLNQVSASLLVLRDDKRWTVMRNLDSGKEPSDLSYVLQVRVNPRWRPGCLVNAPPLWANPDAWKTYPPLFFGACYAVLADCKDGLPYSSLSTDLTSAAAHALIWYTRVPALQQFLQHRPLFDSTWYAISPAFIPATDIIRLAPDYYPEGLAPLGDDSTKRDMLNALLFDKDHEERIRDIIREELKLRSKG